jgi:hypothetical protein
VLLGAGSLRAGGLFTKDWALPAQITDPLAKTQRSAPKPEPDQSQPAETAP